MSKYDVKELKSAGIMKQKEKDLFSLRLRIVGGYVGAEQLPKLAEIATRFGRGHIHLTARQGIEIPFIHFDDLAKVKSELAKVDLSLGACGPRVRTVTACQGLVCSHGLIDSQSIARKIDNVFFGRGGLPHKFKIGVTGCPNACLKPLENDLGINGIVEKEFVEEDCNLCGLCIDACPTQALRIEKDRLVYEQKKCILCGECIFICPFGAWKRKRRGYRIYVGGKMGKWPLLGYLLCKFFGSEDGLLDLIQKVLEFYQQEGKEGERFRETLDRIGLEKLKEKIGEGI
ncbi:MAG: 4Fe-4S binding protein [bacterium]